MKPAFCFGGLVIAIALSSTFQAQLLSANVADSPGGGRQEMLYCIEQP